MNLHPLPGGLPPFALSVFERYRARPAARRAWAASHVAPAAKGFPHDSDLPPTGFVDTAAAEALHGRWTSLGSDHPSDLDAAHAESTIDDWAKLLGTATLMRISGIGRTVGNTLSVAVPPRVSSRTKPCWFRSNSARAPLEWLHAPPDAEMARPGISTSGGVRYSQVVRVASASLTGDYLASQLTHL